MHKKSFGWIVAIVIVALLLFPSAAGSQSGSDSIRVVSLDTMNLRYFGNVKKGDTLLTFPEVRNNFLQLQMFHELQLQQQQSVHNKEHARWDFVVDSLRKELKRVRDAKTCRVAGSEFDTIGFKGDAPVLQKRNP